jgi:hypothetical protein
MNKVSEYRLQRRVAGFHDIRMDGLTDLVLRAKGSTVFDVGCNRGLVSFEMANNGAIMCHGCDIFEEGVATAREIFADLRNCESNFQVVDLTKGQKALDQHFGRQKYDIVLMLATYHKLKRSMPERELSQLMRYFGEHTIRWFGWRGTSEKADENQQEMAALDREFREIGLKRIHTSYISQTLGVAAIWERL